MPVANLKLLNFFGLISSERLCYVNVKREERIPETGKNTNKKVEAAGNYGRNKVCKKPFRV